MKHFTQGKYLGTSKNELSLGGIILSETFYEERFSSEWHTHENPYLAFVLKGGCVEKRKKDSAECDPGKLLFYSCGEPHLNHSYQPDTRMFNVELNHRWMQSMDFGTLMGNGIITPVGPNQKFLLLKIFREYRLLDHCSSLNIETITIDLLTSIRQNINLPSDIPKWAVRLKEVLHDRWSENISLKELSEIIRVHPVTISRYFPIHFKCTLGDYIRKIRIDKSLNLIRAGDEKLTDIALASGFADQSHFIRTFKKVTGLLPNEYRNL